MGALSCGGHDALGIPLRLRDCQQVRRSGYRVHGLICGQRHRIELGLDEGLRVGVLRVEADRTIFATLPVCVDTFGNVTGDGFGRHVALPAKGAAAKSLGRRGENLQIGRGIWYVMTRHGGVSFIRGITVTPSLGVPPPGLISFMPKSIQYFVIYYKLFFVYNQIFFNSLFIIYCK